MTERRDAGDQLATLIISRRAFLTGLVTAIAVPALVGDACAGRALPPAAADAAQRRVRTLPRIHHTTTETAMGTMVVGGYHNGALASAHIFDGQAWHDAPPMLTARYQHAAVPYGNGLIVAGGVSAAGNVLS